ncbi:unnamed protein product, partial [Durusdinium trenchii]
AVGSTPARRPPRTGRPMWRRLQLAWCLLSLSPVASTGAVSGPRALCLPTAVSADLRKNLTNAEGESFPVGMVVQAWASAELVSALMEILISEMLGYHVRVDPTAAVDGAAGIHAVLGCRTWMNEKDRGCDTRQVTNHLLVESWWLGWTHVVEDLTEIYKAEMPVSGGEMGYDGDEGIFVPQRAMQAGQAEGIALDFYKSYNASWHKPWRFFMNITVMNLTDDFMPCVDTMLVNNATGYYYWKLTGDDDGVVITGQEYAAFCENGYTWMSPSCRNWPSSCVIYLTGGNGWGVLQGMQRAAVFNIPLGIAVARSWSKYVALPSAYTTLLNWWTPDDSFLELNPTPLIFPRRSELAHLQQDLTSAMEAVHLTKLISHDLEFMAPGVVQFLRQSQIYLSEVNDLMRARKAGHSIHEAACEWLRSHETRWRPWIPDPTACARGYGLHDEYLGEFTSSRPNATGCKACLPGTYSDSFQDDQGRSYVCTPCPAGTEQPAAGEVVCKNCPVGTFKAVQSSDQCTPCPKGFYQNHTGAQTCKECPQGTTTLLLGAKRGSECVCRAGSIDLSSAESEVAHCAACPDGLTCPDGSTMNLLQSGDQTGSKADQVPGIAAGFFSWPAEPLKVFKCRTARCPGGSPGTCQGGALGPTCAACSDGEYWENGQCSVCQVSLKAFWYCLPILVIALLVAAYYMVETHYLALPSLAECSRMGFEMMLNFVQNIGVLSLVIVPWPEGLKELFEFSEVFVLSLQSYGLNCTSSSDLNQYLVAAGLFLSFAAVAPCLGYLSQWVPCLRRRDLSWSFYRTICTIGKIYQSLFVTMCSIGLSPFMCYLHPNGLHSMLKYPNMLCGSIEHGIMRMAGVAVLTLSASHFVLCCWACYQAPSWSRKRPDRLTSVGFLILNFRPSSWWYSLIILLRGLFISVGQVIAPDAQGVQLLVMSLIMIVSLSLQLYVLPWKAPLLNLVDAVSTVLFLTLLAVALHLSPVDSQSFLDAFGSIIFFFSLALITSLGCLMMGMLALQRCCRTEGSHIRLLNLGTPFRPADLLMLLDSMCANLMRKHEVERQTLLRKMSSGLSLYDIHAVESALKVLCVDFELLADESVRESRIVGERISRMKRRTLLLHSLSEDGFLRLQTVERLTAESDLDRSQDENFKQAEDSHEVRPKDAAFQDLVRQTFSF